MRKLWLVLMLLFATIFVASEAQNLQNEEEKADELINVIDPGNKLRLAPVQEAKGEEKTLLEKYEDGTITPEEMILLEQKKKKKSILAVYEKVKLPKKIFWFTLLGLYTVFVIVTTSMYFYVARNTDEFRFKSRSMALIAAVTGLLFCAHSMSTEALVPYYPCFLRIWASYCLLFVYSASVIIRAIRYIAQVRTILFKNEMSQVLSSLDKIPAETNSANETEAQERFLQIRKITRVYRLILNKKYPDNIYDKLVEVKFRLNASTRLLDMVRTRNYLIITAISFLIAVAFSIYFSTYEEYSIIPVSFACKTGITTPLIPMYAFITIVIFSLVPLILLCVGFSDAYGMKMELMVTMTYSVVSLTAFIIYNEFASAVTLMYVTGYVFIMPIFFLQQNFIIVNPLRRLLKSKKQTAIINKDPTGLAASSKREQFEGLLAYPAGFSRLCQAALETFCPENVEFLKDYQLLKYRICSYVVSYSTATEEKSLKEVPLDTSLQDQQRLSPGKDDDEQRSRSSVADTRASSVKSIGENKINLEKDRPLSYLDQPHSGYYMGTIDSNMEPESVDMDQLIGGDLVPPLPITIPEAVYKMGLMLDLHLINEAQGHKDRTTPKLTPVPSKLKEEFLKLYNKYIEENAILAVNIPVKVSAPVAEAAEKGTFTLGIFDDVLEDVLKSLYNNTYPVMLKTL
ncbi:hypothetical protein BB560_005676 [Smittium megazygosporum]|uniref:RGS domain-containing protein n=1 Tax=Smittium megazygosporum TaxID=133381 RepID=A0A2T9Z1J8_9FUNG|nr:hypothetical protein BB560_005676 [Smittium megazygosporum]